MKTWTLIPGWFGETDALAYRRIVRAVPSGARIAEVGCWLGRSMCALATILHEERKQAFVIAIDTFKGTQAEPCRSIHAPIVAEHGGSLRSAFEANVGSFGLYPAVLEMTSAEAAEQTADGSLDAIFIDAEHTFAAVHADISAWLPKMKAGAFIAGHDINHADVFRAVSAHFTTLETIGDSWIARNL